MTDPRIAIRERAARGARAALGKPPLRPAVKAPAKPVWRDISSAMLRDLRIDVASGLSGAALLDRIDDMLFRLKRKP